MDEAITLDSGEIITRYAMITFLQSIPAFYVGLGIGLLVGASVGVCIMALLVIGRRGDEAQEEILTR